jgi:hypothetical protein
MPSKKRDKIDIAKEEKAVDRGLVPSLSVQQQLPNLVSVGMPPTHSPTRLISHELSILRYTLRPSPPGGAKRYFFIGWETSA